MMINPPGKSHKLSRSLRLLSCGNLQNGTIIQEHSVFSTIDLFAYLYIFIKKRGKLLILAYSLVGPPAFGKQHIRPDQFVYSMWVTSQGGSGQQIVLFVSLTQSTTSLRNRPIFGHFLKSDFSCL